MPRPNHFEIHAENIERAQGFYRALFGWEFIQWADQSYWLIKTGELGTSGIDGGLVPRNGPLAADTQPVNAFVCTVDVPNVDTTMQQAVDLGGTVALPKRAVPTMGWIGYLKDTEGNLFGVIELDSDAA